MSIFTAKKMKVKGEEQIIASMSSGTIIKIIYKLPHSTMPLCKAAVRLSVRIVRLHRKTVVNIE